MQRRDTAAGNRWFDHRFSAQSENRLVRFTDSENSRMNCSEFPQPPPHRENHPAVDSTTAILPYSGKHQCPFQVVRGRLKRLNRRAVLAAIRQSLPFIADALSFFL